ncbi:MAG: flavodoxin domain-containing protein [Bacteroidales bacterium]|nr:flavodoxin domain-containing protein [Bacteroidales bacterium]
MIPITEPLQKLCNRFRKSWAKEKAQIFSLKEHKKINLSDYEQIIVGGSVHAGQVQKKVKKFCTENEAILLKKPLGLFLCGMHIQEADNEIKAAFPESLRNHAKSVKFLGGEFLFDKMNIFEKTIVKKIAGVKESKSALDESTIKSFSYQMQA